MPLSVPMPGSSSAASPLASFSSVARAWEPRLWNPIWTLRPAALAASWEAEEVFHGGHRWLLQVEIGRRGKHGQGQGGVCLYGRGHDDDIRAVVAGQEFIEIGVNGRAVRQGSVGRGMGIGDGDEFHHALRAEPFKVAEMVCSEAVDSHQGDSGRCCPDCRGPAWRWACLPLCPLQGRCARVQRRGVLD
jgi:hypothetical protein